MRIRELHPDRTLRDVRIVQCLYPSVRYRADCRAHVLRLAHGAVHTPDHRADLLTNGAFPARIPVATGDCRHGRDIQLEGFIRTFPTDPLRFLHLHVLCALLHQPVHLPGSGLQEDQLDDDALFRHQFYPADVYILVYMLEKTFGYVSSITLVELSNINTPILKKLSEISPGTFQHSLQMSILASEAAAAIGANAQLVRTGAMYHDIGKMANPAFFTENQSSINPHSQLSFDQSAKIIINHVNDGVKIAEKAMLPKAIIDFIRTHHGRGKAKYFYNSFKNQYPDREIDEEAFTYPGPNPFSKETAVLMMADSVEAASRSLKEHTEENIRALVDKIIDGQIADGLMRNAPLTFKDVETVKNVFVEKLKIMYHTRISYPDLKK